MPFVLTQEDCLVYQSKFFFSIVRTILRSMRTFMYVFLDTLGLAYKAGPYIIFRRVWPSQTTALYFQVAQEDFECPRH